MRYRYLIVVIAIINLLLPSFLYAVSANNSPIPNNLTLVADKWCPYTCDRDDELPGLLVEIVTTAFSKQNMTVTYQQTSWVRGIELTKAYSNHILLGSTRRYQDEFTFLERFYIPVESAFLHLSDNSYNIKKPEDIATFRVGYVHGYQYDDNGFWAKFLKELPYSVGISAAMGEQHLFKLLDRGRIDIALINYDLANYYLKSMNLTDKFTAIRRDIVVPVFLAFQQSAEASRIKSALEQNIHEMYLDGRLKKIFDKYQINLPEYF